MAIATPQRGSSIKHKVCVAVQKHEALMIGAGIGIRVVALAGLIAAAANAGACTTVSNEASDAGQDGAAGHDAAIVDDQTSPPSDAPDATGQEGGDRVCPDAGDNPTVGLPACDDTNQYETCPFFEGENVCIDGQWLLCSSVSACGRSCNEDAAAAPPITLRQAHPLPPRARRHRTAVLRIRARDRSRPPRPPPRVRSVRPLPARAPRRCGTPDRRSSTP